MPSPGHEVTVVLLEGEPWLLSALADKLLGKALPCDLKREDSTVRFGTAREVRPDLIFTVGDSGRWVALEVQLRRDQGKVYGWPVLVCTLLNERRVMGDLVILTSSRRVAKWAAGACHAMGTLGTEHRMAPTVLWICDDNVDQLLDRANPRLAYFAAWAMRDRCGPRALQVVEEALEITNLLPDPLRQAQTYAILCVLNQRLRSKLKVITMSIDTSRFPKVPEWLMRWAYLLGTPDEVPTAERLAERLELWHGTMAELKAKREALLTIFKVRGLTPIPREQARIRQCLDPETLDRWIARAVHASSVKQALAAERKPRARRTLPAATAQLS